MLKRKLFMSGVVLLILCSACIPPVAEQSTPSPVSPGDDWIQVYFTTPQVAQDGRYWGGPDEKLAAAIDQARLSVDMAMYNFNLWSIRDALVAAQKRGVNVRVVLDSDNLDEAEVQDLLDAGIPVIGDRRDSLMHHKFAIIDRREVWTGSMNFSVGGAYKDANNLLRLQDTKLAEDFLVEFDEMFEDDLFSSASPANTPYPTLTISGQQVEVYFSPDDGVLGHLISLVEEADKEVRFLAYSFTADRLAETMLQQAQAGVDIRGVFDESQVNSNTGGEFERLKAAGMDVRLANTPNLMHHKVLIIDRQIVAVGSYNFTRSAEVFNDENMLILHDSALAEQFLQVYDALYAAAD